MLHNHKNALVPRAWTYRKFDADRYSEEYTEQEIPLIIATQPQKCTGTKNEAVNRILEFSGKECTCTLSAVYTSTPAGFAVVRGSGSETTAFAYCKRSKLEAGTAWE